MDLKRIDDANVALILKCYTEIEKGIQWSEYPNGKQAGLQHLGNDPWTDAVGRMNPNDNWKNAKINPYFIGTIFEELIVKYKITRTRLIWLKPYSCYSMHKDDSIRLHIPLITNENCFFVFKNEGLFEMPAGGVYEVNTIKYHSAMNCSTEWRLHLLGAF